MSSHAASLPAVDKAKHELNPILQFARKVMDDGVLQFAQGLAYSLLLSVGPLLIGTLGIVGVGYFLTGHSAQDLTNLLAPKLQSLLPAANIANTVKTIQQQSGTVGLIGILTSLIAGAGFFQNVDYVLSVIFRLKQRNAFAEWRMSLLMVLALIPLILVMVLATSIPSVIIGALQSTTGANSGSGFFGFISWVLSFVGGTAAAFILFALVYIVVPNQKVPLKEVWKGALIAGLLLEVYTLLFPFYATHFLKPNNYGANFGFALVIIVFFYYFAVILLLGAEINSWLLGRRELPGTLPQILYNLQNKGEVDTGDLREQAQQGQDKANDKQGDRQQSQPHDAARQNERTRDHDRPASRRPATLAPARDDETSGQSKAGRPASNPVAPMLMIGVLATIGLISERMERRKKTA